jgi:hypothetical protein
MTETEKKKITMMKGSSDGAVTVKELKVYDGWV